MATFTQELDALIDQVFPGSSVNPRDKDMAFKHFGWDGEGGQSLQHTGDIYKLTRERIRQITSRFAISLEGAAQDHLKSIPKIINTIQEMAPASADRIEDALVKELGENFMIEGAMKAAVLFFGTGKHFRIYKHGNQRYLILPDMEKTPEKVISKAQKNCTHLGFTHINEMLDLLPGIPEERALEYIRDILSSRDDAVWLDKEKNIMWLKDAPRNRFINCLHKMLMLLSSTTVDNVIYGANRYFRKGKGSNRQIKVPSEVVANLINSWGQATCSPSGIVRKTEQFNSTAQLIDMEKDIAETIWATKTKIAREKELENILVPVIDGVTHPRKYNFSISLNYSPLIMKGEKRGQYIVNGSI